MAQEYTISNAYPAKDKAGNEKTWDSQYGTFKVWNLYFEGDDTKYQTNKKIDFQGFAKGETVYGTTGTDKYGNGTFKSEQRPFNSQGQSAPAQQPNFALDGRVEKLEKDVAYLKSLLENSPNFKSGESTSQGANEDGAEAYDNIAAIPY